MQPFRLKPDGLLDEQDFVDYPMWATYYEPDDIATLGELGFDREEVRKAIEGTGYSDEYSFPLPAEAGDAPFHYVYLSVRATTQGGNQLVGFLTGACLGLFHAGVQYRFNPHLREGSSSSAATLSRALGEEGIFPVQLEVVATSTLRAFDI